jgi:Ferritin-like
VIRTRPDHRHVRAITDIDGLRDALQTAIVLEHSTIPPYLCALYSIHQGHNTEVAALIESVVMEEMLHIVLAANVLNAIGGSPRIDRRRFVPRYPATLPHSDGRVVVGLERLSPEALATFRRIERPEPAGTPPTMDGYHTIGQFYAGIELGLQQLAVKEQIFTGKARKQIDGAEHVYGMAGAPFAVDDLDSALAALAIIIDQGEGIDHTIHDGDTALDEGELLAHFYRFDEIAKGRRYLPSDTPRTGPTGPPLPVDFEAVWPMRAHPRVEDLPPGSEVRALTDEANRVYTDLLRCLHRGLNGAPDELTGAVGLMWSLRWKAEALMRIPVGPAGETAGPTFQWCE